MAGPWFTAAVPEVQTTAAGVPFLSAMPRATCAADRSSMTTCVFISGWLTNEMMNGAFLDPGLMTASLSPN